MKRLAVLFALALLAGCSSPQPTAIRPSDPQTPAPPPPQAPAAVQNAQTTQDLWLVPPVDLLQGRTQSGTHYPLPTEIYGAKVSPDGKRVLLFVVDKSRSRTTNPAWIEVLDLATQQQWRLTPESDWLEAWWLPDGRIVLVGSRVWLSDSAAQTLQDLGETGGTMGTAFDGRQQVAWTSRFSPSRDQTNQFHVHLLNLSTGAVTEFPEIYYARVSPHAGVPLVFSPDGSRLAFVDKAEGKAELVIMGIASGQKTRIEVDASADVALWDQRGLWVRRRAGDDWKTVRLDEQGEDVQVLPDSSPSLSPDGRWSATSRYTPQMVTQPALVDARTGDLYWLNADGYYPSGWAPTGELVLVQQSR